MGVSTVYFTICEPASYIWSDLHYQDIKGRISGKFVDGV